MSDHSSSSTKSAKDLCGIPRVDVEGTALNVISQLGWMAGCVMLVTSAIAVAIAAFGYVPDVIRGQGVLDLSGVETVRAPMAGKVVDVRVSAGQLVDKGALVLTLDSAGPAAELSVAMAEQAAAEMRLSLLERQEVVGALQKAALTDQRRAEVARARAQLRERLIDFGISMDVQSVLDTYAYGGSIAVDRAVSDVKGAEAALRAAVAQQHDVDVASERTLRELDVKAADARVRRASAQLASTDIRVISEGNVLYVDSEHLVGSFVQPGDVLLQVGNPQAWRVVLDADERSWNRLHEGARVRVRVRAFELEGDIDLDAMITHIEEDPSVGTSGKRRLRAFARLAPSAVAAAGNNRLQRGYTVEWTLVGNSRGILDHIRGRQITTR